MLYLLDMKSVQQPVKLGFRDSICIALTAAPSSVQLFSLRAPKATSLILPMLDSYQFSVSTQSISIVTIFINILLPRLVSSYDFS